MKYDFKKELKERSINVPKVSKMSGIDENTLYRLAKDSDLVTERTINRVKEFFKKYDKAMQKIPNNFKV